MVPRPSPPSTQVTLTIGGMTCGACAARIERRLNDLDGVSARVNYASERATVTVPPELMVERLVAEIATAGYSATVVSSPGAGAQDGDDLDRRVRSLRRRLLVAAVLFMPLCDLSLAFWLVPSLRFTGWQWLLAALAAPVVTWAAWPFHAAAFRGARHRTTTMDTLVSLGVVSSTCWSIYAMFWRDTSDAARSMSFVLAHGSGGGIYLDVAAGVTTFLLAGRYFEASATRRAGSALRALATVGAKEVAVLDADGFERCRPVDELGVGDRFVVRPGQTVATDGEVVSGRSAVDRSAMTGESLPVEVEPGDAVVGGTVSIDGRLVVRATKVGQETQLAQMVRLVEQAQNEKAKVQRLADRISAVFVPAVLAMAVVTLAGWLLAGGTGGRAFSAALSVLVIACPCALGLATPAALVVASGRGARLGIFFKGYQALEASRQVDTVVLDKTGTLTTGQMAVTDVEVGPGIDRASLLRVVGAVEAAAEHPIARAVAAYAAGDVMFPAVENLEVAAGLGVRGSVEGHQVVVGRPAFVAGATTVPVTLSGCAARWEAQGKTAVVASVDGVVAGVIAVADTVRPTAAAAVRGLQALGLRCVLLSGDHQAAARAVADSVGIGEVVAEALPGDKVAIVRRLQAEGRSVAMVGDGINDGPALAAADLGLAVGSGTDVAITAADLIVVRDDLVVVPTAIALARRTLRTIRANLAWAFGYNVVALPLAACGLLNPLIAGGAMALSSAFVVWNSSRLRHVQGVVPVPVPVPPADAPDTGIVLVDLR